MLVREGEDLKRENWIGRKLRKDLLPGDWVLDLGCGIIQWAQDNLPKCEMYVAVDAYERYLENLPDGVTGTELGKLPGVCSRFEDDAFDVVLLIDVLEHLTIEDGRATLAEAERIARRAIYVYTPIGLMEQDACDAWGLGENPLQEHISGWEQEELEELGFTLLRRKKVVRGPTMLMLKELA